MEVASELAISQAQISRIEKNALKNMRNYLQQQCRKTLYNRIIINNKVKKEVIITAKTVDEAVALAVVELGAPDAASIEYTVLEEAKKGLFLCPAFFIIFVYVIQPVNGTTNAIRTEIKKLFGL